MTSVYKYQDKGNLNVDLVDEFVAKGHQVDVMTPVERRHRPQTRVSTYPGLRVIEFPCLNFRGKVNLIEKGVSTLSLGILYRRNLRRHLGTSTYDLAIYTTLPITYAPAIRFLKKRRKTICYLLHKDIFPQSAVDLGLIRRNSPPYWLFRWIEKRLYSSSDIIGVMSERNVEYVLQHNPSMAPNKVEVCPNSIRPRGPEVCAELRSQRTQIREEYSIPENSVVYMYGGNISRAQGIDFIVAVAKRFEECPGSFLLFVGSGNEMGRLRAEVANSNTTNVGIIEHLDSASFARLVAACDVGLVFLDHRFTIANIPSRTLAHLNFSQPIVAATDEFTDFGDMLTASGAGLWSPSNDVDALLENVRRLTDDSELRNALGANARRVVESTGHVSLSYAIIASHLPQYGDTPPST